ncbi:VWA domain-containing protein [Bacillus salacetis]|uniref:VWA domain-containing protein n=1 Tax=Bacillus salacetis TaxID=2315464 RepID=A0A3A1R9R6_9BACI|nr:vWA domain-containing protein [Bacillus salacetis]RIW37710.1 VWA domain-containing protein [Bacillus salacetis]
MKKKVSFGIIFAIIFSFISYASQADAAVQPSIDFSVQPSATEYVKPQNGDAQGRLDIELTPRGQATNEERKPIDVVFVHDTSGSMKDTYGGVKKATSAENALKESLKFFEQNKQSNDKYYFVPFDSDVSYKSTGNKRVEPTEGISNIKSMAENLDYGDRSCFIIWCSEYDFSEGGTNYTQSLDYALTKFSGMRDASRYIIFLTDGEPTSLRFNNQQYTLYTNGRASIGNYYEDYNTVKKTILQKAISSSEKLGANEVKMYSIAFAQPGEVNYQLLETMSNKTGGRAIQANPDSLSNVFTDISKEFNSPSIDGEIQIDLSKFNGKVKLAANSDAYVDNRNIVHMKYNFTYPIGKQPSPGNIQMSLPLEFTERGQYVFDNIKLIYKDFDGKTQPAVTHRNVTINIVDEAAPKFESSVKINGNQYHSTENLVKMGMQNNEHNEFSIEYDLTPSGILQNNKSGMLNGMRIVQPLPEGISLKSPNLQTSVSGSLTGASVREIDSGGQRALEITLGKTINYSGSQFSPNRLNVKAVLQAEFAMSLVKMPKAAIYYNDTNFSRQSHTLTSHSGYIGLQVMLKGLTDSTSYIGDHTGKLIKKNDGTNEVLAEETPKPLPVKGLELRDGNTIRVHFKDDSYRDIYLKTDFDVYENNSKKILANNEKTTGPASFKISRLVGGENVIYRYKIKTSQTDSGWVEFNAGDSVPIPGSLSGEVEIQVKTEGGFTLDQQPVKKKIVIVKKVSEINVTPNPIEVNVGESIAFEVEVLPAEAADKSITIYLQNGNGTNAEYSGGDSQEHRIIGVKAGEDRLIIEANDGSGIQKIIPVTVIDPYVALEEIRFKQDKINLPLTEAEIPIERFLIFNPENATNKELAETISSSDAISVVEENGKWYIKTEELGFTTVTVTAEEDKSITDSAVFEVVTPEEGGDDNPYLDGRW